MPQLDHDGDSLHYAVAGNGPGVMLLHSLGGSLAMWETTVAALKADFTVAAFDARGHGRSSGNKPFTMERFAADAMALADRLAFQRFHVIGLSMGGRAAMRIAIHWPERVESLVAADTRSAVAAAVPTGWPRYGAGSPRPDTMRSRASTRRAGSCRKHRHRS